MRLLLTGASGFIGKNLIASWPDDAEVIALHRDPLFPAFVTRAGKPNVVPYACDLQNPEQVRALRARFGDRFDACVYLAANGDPALSTREPGRDLGQNAVALVTLLAEAKIGRLVFFSSGAVYEGLAGPVTPESAVSPSLPYAISKLASEQYVRFFHQRARSVDSHVIVRFFGAYGPHEPERKVYTRLVRRFGLEGNPRFTVTGDGKNLIDAMHISDAVEAIHAIRRSPVTGRTVDLCSGSPLSLDALVRAAATAFGIEPQVEHQGEVPEYIQFTASSAAAAELFGIRPRVGLSEGLHALADHLRRREP